MSWFPFILTTVGLVAFILAMVYGLGNESYRNWVKARHRSPWLILLILITALGIPFISLYVQN